MTDEEYDLFFINLLKTILSDLEDTYNYNKNYSATKAWILERITYCDTQFGYCGA